MQCAPHFITDYRKRGGLTVISAMTFEKIIYVKKERQERKRNSSRLMTFCLSLTTEAPHELKKKQHVIVAALRVCINLL